MPKSRYIPALSFRWLTPLYDAVLKWVMREDTFKHELVQQVNIQVGMKVLDLGCGTGTLTLMLKQSYPFAEITGMDGDPQVLRIAREKSRGVIVQWDEGLATSLPYVDAAFDRVVTAWSFTTSSWTISVVLSRRSTAFSSRTGNHTCLILARRIPGWVASSQAICTGWKKQPTTSTGRFLNL
jgi:hypothetical protein